ncbi:hypothetical protein E3N88_12699 [Mikania micrantha]|uniref:Uncharacterized protein n=1 Tax=Mikania micrantha TaxID=192012 RepID=A0A5N6P6F8_9ASTR|nr:hypothetical protein E3N88_12699 [Mikania micrantha]
MASGFSGGYPDFFNVKSATAGRSTSTMNMSSVNGSNYSRQVNYRPPLAGIIQESLFPVAGTRSDLIGKRSLVEFQQQQSSVYSRNVKPRAYNQLSDFLVSPEVSSVSNFSSSSPVSQLIQPERFITGTGNFTGVMSNDQINRYTGRKQPQANQEMDRKMLNRLRELEKELLLDDEEEQNDAVSVVTGTQLSETRLPNPVQAKKPVNIISPSPTTSSSSSSASSSAAVSPKQLISDAAEAISDGKSEMAMDLITRLNQFSGAHGTPEQRLGFYIAAALRSRLNANSTAKEQCSLAAELYKKEHYKILDFKLSDISKQGLAVAAGEVLAVNLAFKLNKLPDESVTTENLRDEVLRRVKHLCPAVVTVAEQDLNTNTASFTARVNEVFGYYTSFVDSFDATIPRDNPERVKIEEGLSRRIMNTVACEGRDRVERCEVLGKWRARMRMAGFEQKPVSQATVDSLLLKVNSGTRGNPGFTVKEDSGGVSFGWLGRSLTIVSAWH